MPSTPQTYPPLGIKFFVANLISLLVYARTIDAKYAFALFEEVLDPELGELYFRKATESVFTTFQALINKWITTSHCHKCKERFRVASLGSRPSFC